MAKYLDPCSDLVFKKIFGEHPHLLISFLNAVLPLPSDGLIESLEYLNADNIPTIPEFKHTIVDVRCTDQKKRIFIVEMQIAWVPRFKERMLFNASAAYVKQLRKKETYKLLHPVYGLAILGENFDPDPEWYHHYKIVNVANTNKTIDDLQLVFLELPKFKAVTWTEKKLVVLWLRFMSEINEQTKQVDQELLEVPEIREALSLLEESAYSSKELEYYDSYWDAVRREKTIVEASEDKGRVAGEAKGRTEAKLEIAKTLLEQGLSLEAIQKITKLSMVELNTLLEKQ